MAWVIVLGTITTLLGLAGLGLFVRKAAQLRGETDKDAVRRRLHGLVALNMAAVGVAFFGLALVVVGLMFSG